MFLAEGEVLCVKKEPACCLFIYLFTLSVWLRIQEVCVRARPVWTNWGKGREEGRKECVKQR